MVDIEPELTHGNIALLDEKYANESPEEKQQRATRYAAAMERCFGMMDLVLSLQKEDMARFRTVVMERLQHKSTADDAEAMSRLENSLKSA